MRRARVQIQPRVTLETKALLDTECTKRRVTQGEVIEEALDRLLHPDAQEGHDVALPVRLMTEIHTMLTQLILALGQEAPGIQEEPKAKPQIATFAQMYEAPSGEEGAAVEDIPAAFQKKEGTLHRLFGRGRR